MAILCFETVKIKGIVPLIMNESSLINPANPLTKFSCSTHFLCGAGAAVKACVCVGGGGAVKQSGAVLYRMMDIWPDGPDLSEEEGDWIGWQADRQAMTALGGRPSLIHGRNTRRRKV